MIRSIVNTYVSNAGVWSHAGYGQWVSNVYMRPVIVQRVIYRPIAKGTYVYDPT